MKPSSDIPNAVYPTPGMGLTLGLNGVVSPLVLAPSPTDGQVATFASATGSTTWATPVVPTQVVAVIQDVLLSVDTASFDFTSIPATYNCLVVRGMLRGTNATASVTAQVRLNNDSAANYDSEDLAGSNSSAVAANLGGATSVQIADLPGATARANRPGYLEFSVPMYAETTFEKIFQSVSGFQNPGVEFRVDLQGGAWRSTAAVNRITILPSAGNWKAGSHLILYGSL